MIMCLQAALYKPNMVGIQRDVPPEIGGPISQPSSQQDNVPPFSSEPQQGPKSASRGPGGTFPAVEPKRLNVPDGGSIRYSKDLPQTDNGYNRGLARSAPLAPPGGRVKPYVGDGYVGGSSQREPNSNLPPSYSGRDSPNEIIPEGYGSNQNAATEPKYQIPKKPPAVPQSSYSNKPNPFTGPRPAQTNPFSLDTFSASSPAGPNNKQRNNELYPPQGQGYPQQNSYPSSQQIQPQQSNKNLQPYGPARPSEKGRDPSNEEQFNIPGDFPSKLDNAGPPPPGTNKIGGPGKTLPGTPAFPAPFGFPESLKVGQNSPFKNLVSFNSPRPFKSRSSIPFPDKGDIFGGFSNSNYETPAAPAAAEAPESRPAEVAANQQNRPAYRIDYPEARESQNSYSPTSRGSNPAYPPQDGAAYNTRQTGTPYFPPQSSSNLGYGFPVQNGGLYGNPYGYSNPPNGQCFRYTYAAEGYRLSDIGKNYPQ
ncbi:hypothetical protein PoB_007690600 [Plakobranchus ocellatus]|uniref:Enamelin n=1 Tax=Plakobranchus ocellatus TaxID=259542 RepID=A0AAV4E2Y9_9GAST|nr:hypothetical protein PoB_007690600 [Plakobranchus ocellatus]